MGNYGDSFESAFTSSNKNSFLLLSHYFLSATIVDNTVIMQNSNINGLYLMLISIILCIFKILLIHFSLQKGKNYFIVTLLD